MRVAIDPHVSRYLERVQALPLLSREEEHAVAIRARKGEVEAARELIRANLRYVTPIALGYRRYGIPVGELIAEGNVGLMVAIAKFDPERATRFVTYAAHWIRAYMLEHIIRTFSMVGLGGGPLRSKVFFRLRREKAKLAANGASADEVNEALAQQFGTSPERIAILAQRLESRDVSVDARVRDDSAGTVLDTMASNDPSPEDTFLKHESTHDLSTRVRSAMAGLDPRERFIVEARVMADDPDELSLAEIGRRLGVSRERARQIEARAKEKLRRQLTDTRHAA
jgi:RNA polymerase sigma-32 factor